MTNKTTIEWTEATWNPTVGCTRTSPGCAHCYAKTQHDRRHKASLAGKAMAPQYAQPFEVLQMLDDRLDAPLRRRKPTVYFVNSVSDLFHEDVPDTFIDRVFATMALAPQHTFQILTKRADRMRTYFGEEVDYTNQWYRRVARLVEDGKRDGRWKMPTDYDAQYSLGRSYGSLTCGTHATRFLPNVWLGVSVENQHFADDRIPLLLQTPAAVRFISAEPLLGPVDLDAFVWPGCIRSRVEHDAECGGGMWCDERSLDWAIVGGESGDGARPFHLTWARSIVAQCKAAGVACFVKQLGDLPVMTYPDWRALHPTPLLRARNHHKLHMGLVPLAFNAPKGGDPSEWPEDLRVREMPTVAR